MKDSYLVNVSKLDKEIK